ncbi:MAG: glycerate kinase [Chloroherpetonaceae bacterium]|nr:glycerate kinase [Chloroherpetonaceae bacterium]MDW8436613.1 glycerate kinase [Chloroherpetonaceae bacterium]
MKTTTLNLDVLSRLKAEALLLFKKGIDAVNGQKIVQDALRLDGDALTIVAQGKFKQIDLSQFKRIHLLGVGKASVAMAKGAKEVLGERVSSSFIVTKYGHAQNAPSDLKIVEAAHPFPDENSYKSAREMFRICNEAKEDELILFVVSGGASSLLSFPAGEITLEDKKFTTALLLKAGATIDELNCVRKHLSRIKGGQLAKAAYPATVVSLILSDVVGDNLGTIASGITSPDPTTFDDAYRVIEKYRLEKVIPETVRSRLQRGIEGKIAETPKPDDECFKRAHNIVVGSNRIALKAIEDHARTLGYEAGIVSDELTGEAREVAKKLAARAKALAKSQRKACLIAGGETTVTVVGHGKGGRNAEMALAAAIELQGVTNVVFLSAGTDGTDGDTNAAGAISDGATLARAKHLGLIANEHLQNNDSYNFFQLVGDLVITGPTNTNVMDIQIVLVDACL